MPLNNSVIQLLQVLKGPLFEKNIPYMYLDSVGKITVGVGHNITDHDDLSELRFFIVRFERHCVIGGDKGVPISDKLMGRVATDPEKHNDYDFLTNHRKLSIHDPTHLRKYSTLEMRAPDVNSLFEEDLEAAYEIAFREFGPGFDKFSPHRQAALIDIAFNVGSFHSFKAHFVPAIKGTGAYKEMSETERWALAAQHSKRGKVKEPRNTQITAWLMTSSSG